MTRFTPKGLLIWFICAVFFLYEFLLRTVVGTFQHPIMYDLHLSSFKFTLLSTTTYVLIYGLMQLPVGLIVERFGLKKTLFIAALLCAISNLGFAYSDTFATAVFFRFFTGLGSSFGFICLLISVYEWLPKKNIAFLLGLSQFFGTLGPMLAAGPLEVLSESKGVDWRNIFTILFFVGIAIAFVIFAFVENNHSTKGKFIVLKRPEPIRKTLLTLFTKKQPWFIAIFSGCVYFSIEYLSENEGKNILLSKGFSASFASYMITLAWFFYAIGCPLFGYLSDRLSSRRLPLILSAIACLGSIALMATASSPSLIACAFILLGLGGSGQSVGFATISEHFKKQYLAIALSLNNAIIMIFSSLNAPALSLYLDAVKGTLPDIPSYQGLYFFLAVVSALAIALSLYFIKETYCKSQSSMTILNQGYASL